MRGIATIVLATLVAATLTGCSSSPEDALASDYCATLTEFKETPRDDADFFALGDALGVLELQGQADGVDFDQVGAKVQLECTDAYAYYLNESEKITDELAALNDSLEELLAEYDS